MSILEHDVLREEIKNKLSYDGPLDDEQNLLALGLTSLQIMRLLNMCKKEGVTISFGKLMAKPTLANWMSLISEKRGLDTVVKDRRAEKRTEGPFEMTDVQYAYWVGRGDDQQLGGISTHAYMEFESKKLDVEKLKKAWENLHYHHPMLRARFTKEGMQEIGRKPYEQLFLFRNFLSASFDEKAKHLEEIRERMSHRKLDIENGQVSGMEISQFSEEDFRIHMDLDLMVADVQSLKIILRDLLAKLLTEEGQLFIVEPAKESLEILISQAFMMSDTEDVREEQNQTFMNYEQWKAVLEDSGLVLKLVYPREDSPMEIFGQKLYIAARRKQ